MSPRPGGLRRRAVLQAGAVLAAPARALGAAADDATAGPGARLGPELPPPPTREFRGAWVASVANIDWPSRPGLGAQALRAETLSLLDRALAIGLNALILQVRPAGDALYPSALEPWSEVLSGVQGRPPWHAGEAAWDPLAFWVEQAHRRGLELHAWFNPYRARPAAARSPLALPHLALRRPDLQRRYGDLLWMDPGEPEAAAHVLAVVADVVSRYDIDGVHLDDYFYPYPQPALPAAAASAPADEELPFPDDGSFARYRLAGGALARDDWRRANVDALVQGLYRGVHAIKPWVRVGLSPFGIGRPALRPPGVEGFSQYDKLYADVEHWLAEGWLDYLAPQLYWPISRAGQPFGLLLESWIAANPLRRHLWPGLFSSQVPKAWPAAEIAAQLALLRRREGASGHIHFSMVALLQDRDGLATLIQAGPYAEPALVPATPWLGAESLRAPHLQALGSRIVIEPAPGPPAARWALWRRRAGQWQLTVLAPGARVADALGADALVLCAVDRTGHLGEPGIIRLP